MPEPSATRIGRLMHDIRRMPLYRQLAPMESGVGWPIPVRHRPGWDGGTAVYVRFPLYGFQHSAGRGTSLFPPFATLTLDWRTGRPMEYADLRLTRPWPMSGRQSAVGTFPHDAVRGSAAAYRAGRERLLAGYDEMLDALRDLRPFTGRAEFTALLRQFMEPDLEPYYRALGPRFFTEFLGPGVSAADRPGGGRDD